MLRRGAGRLLTGRVAFLVAGLLDLGVVARLLLVYLWRTRLRRAWLRRAWLRSERLGVRGRQRAPHPRG